MDQIFAVGDWRSFATTANSAFLLAFSSLFSIINPVGGALIFYGFTKDFNSLDRVRVAARVGFYSLLIMFGALWLGTAILAFFGVSIDALRIAGGMVIALSGFQLLTTSDFRIRTRSATSGKHSRIAPTIRCSSRSFR